MPGSIVKRGSSWAVVIDLPRLYDPETGKSRRRQKWITVHGTRQDAENKLAEILVDLSRQQFVEPSTVLFGAWLDEWLETAVKPPACAPRTYERYRSAVDRHIIPALGAIRLQQLRTADIQRYYRRAGLSPSTLALHHSIVHGALQAAVQQGLVARNVAELVAAKPRRSRAPNDDARENCWTAEEAKLFLAAARAAGPRQAAFYTLALDTGARKNELAALRWDDVDLDRCLVTISRQLLRGPSTRPAFGPPKNHKPRTIEIAPGTATLLRQWKVRQLEEKMANRQFYQDFGLVFTDEYGLPLRTSSLGQREFAQLIKAAGVKRIKFHGLRHTCATLLLQAGVPAKVVQERLGHKSIEVTMNIYSHVLPSMQREAAAKLAGALGL